MSVPDIQLNTLFATALTYFIIKIYIITEI
jgi:hypothetical protein